MLISIKSEIDSRVLLYPLIKVLKPFGSILVITSNRQLNRLIEDVDTRTCRDITIILDVDGTADDTYVEYGVNQKDYDFVILDNMAAIDYDVLLVPLGGLSTPDFDDDLQLLINSDEASRVKLIQFGKSLSKSNGGKEEAKKSNSRETKTIDASLDGNYDPAEKFRVKQEVKKVEGIKTYKCKFPCYDDIEAVESEHRFYVPDEGLCSTLYDIFKQQLQVNSNDFRKVAQRKDEYSGYIKSRNSIRED